MALQGSDLFYVQRGAEGHKMPATDLIDFIAAAEGSLNYRGTVDCTQPVGSQLETNPPLAGDIYINTGTGTVDSSGNDSTDSWVGITGEAIENGQRIVFDGTSWDIVGAEAGGGVETIQGTEPIEVDDTDDANPVISVKEATQDAFGVTRLAQDPPASGDLVSTADTDVLMVPHFNELAGRITTAAAGGTQDVVGVDPIEASQDAVTHVAEVSIKDATLLQKGATTLSSTVAFGGAVEDKAVTPKGVSDYAVPLDLRVLDPLN
jgi:hypothetical protein